MIQLLFMFGELELPEYVIFLLGFLTLSVFLSVIVSSLKLIQSSIEKK